MYCFKNKYHKKQMEYILTAVINILLNTPPIYTINLLIITYIISYLDELIPVVLAVYMSDRSSLALSALYSKQKYF